MKPIKQRCLCYGKAKKKAYTVLVSNPISLKNAEKCMILSFYLKMQGHNLQIQRGSVNRCYGSLRRKTSLFLQVISISYSTLARL